MGYAGWVGSYGINYGQRQNDMGMMFAGSEATLSLLEKFGVQYVVIGPKERTEFQPNEAYFTGNPRFELALSHGDTRMYRVLPKM